jgi:hypothetical protein
MVTWLAISTVGLVLLKPKAELHVVSQKLWPNFLICIEHDTFVMATVQPTSVLS